MAVSETGDWLLFIALPLYVLGASRSALDTSTVFLAELIPAVVIGIFGAPLIDRWNPGRLLATLTGGRCTPGLTLPGRHSKPLPIACSGGFTPQPR